MTIDHHALLLQVDDVRLADVTSWIKPGAEVREFVFDQLKVEDARELVRLAFQRPLEAAEQVLVVRVLFFTLDAQHTLLKVLEEPPVSTKFIIVVPLRYPLLSTVRSRLLDVSPVNAVAAPSAAFVAFLEAPYVERLRQVEAATKQDDHEWMQSIKQGLVSYLGEGAYTREVALSRELEMVARLLLTRGASNKMLLEHLALSLPLAAPNDTRYTAQK